MTRGILHVKFPGKLQTWFSIKCWPAGLQVTHHSPTPPPPPPSCVSPAKLCPTKELSLDSSSSPSSSSSSSAIVGIGGKIHRAGTRFLPSKERNLKDVDRQTERQREKWQKNVFISPPPPSLGLVLGEEMPRCRFIPRFFLSIRLFGQNYAFLLRSSVRPSFVEFSLKIIKSRQIKICPTVLRAVVCEIRFHPPLSLSLTRLSSSAM